MATVHVEILIHQSVDVVWDAARDVGALHTRLVPGFVADTRMEPGAAPPVRVVTFASGFVARETIVAVDEAQRRVVWSIDGEGVDHHNGALQLIEEAPGRTRAVWTADVLPDALAEAYAPLMQRGLEVMKATQEA
ncbi:MAG TPA: SRPBCC family protein [Phenylobacterium sp.]|nr:SRPBCC family protein [Phenylobacterium sp.]HQP19115.1 SRPBCC family protein [Phenylobacterium sp.]